MIDSPGPRRGLLLAAVGTFAVLFWTAVHFDAAPPASHAPPSPPPARVSAAPVLSGAPAGGRALSSRTDAPAASPAPASSRRRRAAAAAAAADTETLARLEADNAALRARLSDMTDWVLENLKGRFPLEESQMAHLRIPPVTDDGLVSGDLARLLRLSDAETGRLDDAFSGSRDVLRDLETAAVSVSVDSSPDDPGVPLTATLDFAPYPDDGALVREVLYDELLATLGRARFARFLQVSSEDLAEAFDYFGDRQRTLTVSSVLPDDSDPGAPPLLFIRDETAIPDPDDPTRVLIRASETLAETLPPAYERYAALLPEFP